MKQQQWRIVWSLRGNTLKPVVIRHIMNVVFGDYFVVESRFIFIIYIYGIRRQQYWN